MLRLKRLMVRVVLLLLSAITTALTPERVALRQVPVGKSRLRVIRKRK